MDLDDSGCAVADETVTIASARPCTALVLMGGGARTAYQAGVLKALAAMLNLRPGLRPYFPFQVLVGTSAGALNVAYLASCAQSGWEAFNQLASFWSRIHSQDVYRLRVTPLARLSRLIAAWSLSQHARRGGAVLDTLPLVDLLHRAIALQGIDDALASGAVHALAVTASSYTSGTHWTFCHRSERGPDADVTRVRPGRRTEFQPITIEHLMASSAIPFIFPATPLWVDGRREFFGDGSMRQISPLSPALHLGAQRILTIGVGQPERTAMGAAERSDEPTLGGVAGHAMASVFHDTLSADVERAQRMTRTLRHLPREAAALLPYRPVDVLAIQPSQSLDDLAQTHAHALPPAVRHVLGGLGALKGGGAALASYLLFEPEFVQALMALGERDAYLHKAQLLALLGLGGP